MPMDEIDAHGRFCDEAHGSVGEAKPRKGEEQAECLAKYEGRLRRPLLVHGVFRHEGNAALCEQSNRGAKEDACSESCD